MSFSWPFMREFKRELGRLDAGCQLAEVATRAMLREASKTSDPAASVRDLATAHGIPVRVSAPQVVRNHVGKLYLISVTSSLDHFLTQLSKCGSDTLGSWPSGAESNLAKAREWTGAPVSPEYDVCAYYWAVRNAVVHIDDKGVKRPKPKKLPIDLPQLDAPKGIDAIHYDDFILYTASAKRLAYDLTARSRPTNGWLLRQAVEKAGRRTGSESADRYVRRLGSWLNVEYGLQRDNALAVASGAS